MVTWERRSVSGRPKPSTVSYGPFAGAFYGAAAIPRGWRDRLYGGDAITDLAIRLLERQPAPHPASSSRVAACLVHDEGSPKGGD
jgi:hypothetical protein